MSIAIFMLVFWLGFERFDLQRELKPVSKKEWEEIFRRQRS